MLYWIICAKVIIHPYNIGEYWHPKILRNMGQGVKFFAPWICSKLQKCRKFAKAFYNSFVCEQVVVMKCCKNCCIRKFGSKHLKNGKTVLTHVAFIIYILYAIHLNRFLKSKIAKSTHFWLNDWHLWLDKTRSVIKNSNSQQFSTMILFSTKLLPSFENKYMLDVVIWLNWILKWSSYV